ncbi:MAG: hypothetical protein LC660_00730 [Desulfobacteraceae bacterium]|nr:hypothetical protein [Desulfobacteraceae bacterium]
MDFFRGIKYNIQGVLFAFANPKLLWLGLLRFAIILVLALFFSGLVFFWHEAILAMIWEMPEKGMLLYVWHLASWVLSLLLAAVAVVAAYLVAQVFFCVYIMDYMSRLTEKIVLGTEVSYAQSSWLSFFVYLVCQEIPRAVIPLVITLAVMVMGLFTPLGPVILVLSSITAVWPAVSYSLGQYSDAFLCTGGRNFIPHSEKNRGNRQILKICMSSADKRRKLQPGQHRTLHQDLRQLSFAATAAIK